MADTRGGMDREIEYRGGARIGWFNASWPFAVLRANREEIAIDVRFSGKYSFRRDQVVRIEPYGSLPMIGRGIVIKHTVAEIPERVIFWTLGAPGPLLREIGGVGFAPAGDPARAVVRRGFPVRWKALASVFAAFALLLGLNLWSGIVYRPGFPLFKPFGLPAFLFLFLFSVGTLKSPRVREFALKPGGNIREVRWMFLFLALFTGLFTIASLAVSIFVDIDG